jgi:fructose-specific phosphotransferase system IIA component
MAHTRNARFFKRQLAMRRAKPFRVVNRQCTILPSRRKRRRPIIWRLGRQQWSFEMRLTDSLKPQNILMPMAASTKNQAIGELVALLAKNGEIQDANVVLNAVLEREATRTTGIGNGLAIPHGKCAGTAQLAMAIGKLATPIDFQSVDGRPVSLVWLLASPIDKTGPHIHALARISRLMTSDKFRQALAQAKSAQEIYDVIVQQENSL